MTATSGRLDVIASPIGNVEDLAPRARAALAGADLVAAEDTRRTGTLLAAIGVSRPLLSLHDYNEEARVAELIARLRAGAVVALVSDAGTPLISDPGIALVRAAAAAGIEVRPIPGPSAVTAALSVAGLPTDRFAFEGFLPARAAERRRVLLGPVQARRARWCSSRRRTASSIRWARWQRIFGGDASGAAGARTHQDLRNAVPRHAGRTHRTGRAASPISRAARSRSWSRARPVRGR